MPMRRIVALSLIPALLLAVLASLIVRSEGVSRRLISMRFSSRVTDGADFVSRFLDERRDQERSVARSRFSGPAVDADTYELAVESLGFEAAVLLDSHGRLLAVHPPAPALIGTTIAPRYKHLSAAVAGQDAISDVVPSAVRGEPVVAIAAPYDTPQGLRVFSGAFSVEVGPLAGFLEDMMPFDTARTYLLDSSGTIAASSQDPRRAITSLETIEPELWAAIQESGLPTERQGSTRIRGELRAFHSKKVPDSAWLLVSTTASSELFEPLAGASNPQWAVFMMLVMAAASAVALLLRLGISRDQLTSRLTEQERLNRALEDFSSRAAHDLRSPIAGMQMAVDLLVMDTLPEGKREEIGANLKRQTQRAATLVDDLLMLARASGTARRETIRTDQLLSDLAADVPGVDLVSGEMTPTLDADPVSLRQALLNLIRNSVAYAAGDGQPTVDITARRTGQATTISVADRGPGVPEADKPHLFQPFERGSKPVASGTGLGLVIVMATAEAHGGRAWYADRPGGGAIFNIEIADASP